MDRTERIAKLAAIDAANNFDEEQKLTTGMPGVDIGHDLPTDASNLWRLHHHDMDDEDIAEYQAICKKLSFPFERGVKSYYVTIKTLKSAYDELTAAGFMVALNFDAATTMQSVPIAAATLGRKGGSSKSPAKQKSSRENGKLGGRQKIKK